MSSRALRKLQKQQELQQLDDQELSSDDTPDVPISHQKFNAFDLLNSNQDAEDESDSVESTGEHAPIPASSPSPSNLVKTSAKKKKKQKKRAKKAKVTAEATPEISELDEIDQALKELSTKQPLPADHGKFDLKNGHPDSDTQHDLWQLLSIDPKKLNSMNEMRKLFGNAAVESGPAENEGRPTNRRRDRNRRALDLGSALTGRFSPASRGQSLSGVALRKNLLMQGKDEWPRAASGGLGMEIVQKHPLGVTEYELVYNTAYKDVQRQFEICVESMEPERMIELLQFNPYHISTLLQVSEIAKHQGDHAVSADLLERALFNIGRSAQSSFGNCLKEGKARLDFTIKENREVWLSGWRYIMNLGMKGTWKTAYEWAKFLLSLDPDDPYCIGLVIDQLSVKGREQAHFIELCSHPNLKKRWDIFPNIQCTLGLSYLHLGKPKECRNHLYSAMSRYPWVFCRLAQELNITPVPKAIWGMQPPNQTQELLCELYIARAKDIWNTPEAISLLVEVADSITTLDEAIETPRITEDIARHVLLSDIPAVTTHLPRRFTSLRISASDPLPPQQDYDESPVQPASMVDNMLEMFGLNENEADPVLDVISPSQAEEYVYNEGLDELREFLQVNGVDPGNWEDDADTTQVEDWVRGLRAMDPSRWNLVIEDIAVRLGSPLISGLLSAELRRQTTGLVIYNMEISRLSFSTSNIDTQMILSSVHHRGASFRIIAEVNNWQSKELVNRDQAFEGPHTAHVDGSLTQYSFDPSGLMIVPDALEESFCVVFKAHGSKLHFAWYYAKKMQNTTVIFLHG